MEILTNHQIFAHISVIKIVFLARQYMALLLADYVLSVNQHFSRMKINATKHVQTNCTMMRLLDYVLLAVPSNLSLATKTVLVNYYQTHS
jgi:hypothetical protein